MADDLVIRVAGKGDVAAVASLRLAWTPDTGGGRDRGAPGPTTGDPEPAGHPGPDTTGDHPEFERHLAASIAGESERRTIWLAELAGVAVGMTTLYEFRRMPRPGRIDSRWGYVGNMFVRAECRNRGIGAALLGALIDAATERAYVRPVVSPTARSVPLYRRAGFVDADGEGGELLLLRPGRLT